MEQKKSYLTFRLAGEQYAVTLSSLREIIGGTDVVAVPNAPLDIIGVVNFRGHIVSIFDISQKLKLPPNDGTEENSIIVLQHGHELIGLQVSLVDAVVEIEQGLLEPPPTFSQHPLLSLTESVVRIERQFLVILSTEKLFSFDERNGAVGERFSPSVA